jgi:hypothetical protein
VVLDFGLGSHGAGVKTGRWFDFRRLSLKLEETLALSIHSEPVNHPQQKGLMDRRDKDVVDDRQEAPA